MKLFPIAASAVVVVTVLAVVVIAIKMKVRAIKSGKKHFQMNNLSFD